MAVVEIIVGRWSISYPQPSYKLPVISVWLVEMHWALVKNAHGPGRSDATCEAIATWREGPQIIKREAIWQ